MKERALAGDWEAVQKIDEGWLESFKNLLQEEVELSEQDRRTILQHLQQDIQQIEDCAQAALHTLQQDRQKTLQNRNAIHQYLE